jgi:hypothetical protein
MRSAKHDAAIYFLFLFLDEISVFKETFCFRKSASLVFKEMTEKGGSHSLRISLPSFPRERRVSERNDIREECGNP